MQEQMLPAKVNTYRSKLQAQKWEERHLSDFRSVACVP